MKQYHSSHLIHSDRLNEDELIHGLKVSSLCELAQMIVRENPDAIAYTSKTYIWVQELPKEHPLADPWNEETTKNLRIDVYVSEVQYEDS